MHKDKKPLENIPKRDIHRYIREYFKFIENFEDEVKPEHTAMYMWILNRNNSLFWQPVIEISTNEAMTRLGMKCPKWYRKTRQKLIDWGLIKVERRSTNQNRVFAMSLPYPDEVELQMTNSYMEENTLKEQLENQRRELSFELDNIRNNGYPGEYNESEKCDSSDEFLDSLEPIYE